MDQLHLVADRAMFEGAVELIDRFGAAAHAEAAARACRSRDVGNVEHFVRWRRVERMIEMLGQDRPHGALH